MKKFEYCWIQPLYQIYYLNSSGFINQLLLQAVYPENVLKS